jgi:hypothetical protein
MQLAPPKLPLKAPETITLEELRNYIITELGANRLRVITAASDTAFTTDATTRAVEGSLVALLNHFEQGSAMPWMQHAALR